MAADKEYYVKVDAEGDKCVATEKVAKKAVDAISKEIDDFQKLNIIVMGRTGVGKSTLINAIFGGNKAPTGWGMPVTMKMETFGNGTLNVIDSRGFEMDEKARAQVKKDVLKRIQDGVKAKDVNQAIHCVWYCAETRIDPVEIEWLKELSKESKSTKVPIVVVLTKCFEDGIEDRVKEMERILVRKKSSVTKVVPVFAQAIHLRGGSSIPPYGLEDLVLATEEVLSEELKKVLISAQKVLLSEKLKLSQAVIVGAAAASATAGAIPFPFADCILLIPTQIGMIAGITAIFGLKVEKSVLASLLSSALGTGGATLLGRAVVTNLIKLIPGGQVAAGVVSATTRVTLSSKETPRISFS